MNANELDESGLPVHLPMGVNAAGDGPEDDVDAVRVRCWCAAGEGCTVVKAHQGPREVLPIYFATASKLGFDPHDIGRKIVSSRPGRGARGSS